MIAAPTKAQTAADPFSPSPKVTVLGGFGNQMGWFGGQVERYFAEGRASVFGGLGYTPSIDGSWSGVAVAAGARVFRGERHRVFLEASVSQLGVETPADPSGPKADERTYGPGLSAGYQLAKPGGFTLMVSAGVGHTVGAPSHLEGTAFLFGLGFGHTWRSAR
jgi:hypothetical protein